MKVPAATTEAAIEEDAPSVTSITVPIIDETGEVTGVCQRCYKLEHYGMRSSM